MSLDRKSRDEVSAVVTAGAPGETAPRERFVLKVETKVEASSSV